MKSCLIIGIFLLASFSGYCQSPESAKSIDQVIVLEKRENQKYGLTATFYGLTYRYGENDELQGKMIGYVIFRDNKTGQEARYKPTGRTNNDSTGPESIGTPGFYVTEVFSPDEEYIVLPVHEFDGFAVFESKQALETIKVNRYFDTIKVGGSGGGWFYHKFEKWNDDSTFSFRAGLYGDMFAFRYSIEKHELYCYREGCERLQIGVNGKGKIKPTKMGDIAPTKVR